MQYSGGIHTDKVEGNGACKIDEDGCGSGASVDANPLIGGEIAGGAQCHILKTRDISCGTVRPMEKERRKQEMVSLQSLSINRSRRLKLKEKG